MPHEIDKGFKQSKYMTALSLFTSTGTLLCCALPALLVTLGAGAALAGLVSTVPWLVALSKYKAWTFGVAGFMLLVAGYFKHKAKYLPCPADKHQADACNRMRKISSVIYVLSVLIYLTGFFFAFIAVHIFY
ncbi:MAG: hypothetical protein CMF61_04995 [Magnetococcales bacterium]|nr:hypothetical protein [Magnetococcales bacterium]